jgi:hypothetical protein
MPDMTSIGQAGLQGWRAKVGDAVAPAVAQRAPLSEDTVRAAVGAAFFALSVLYVVKTATTAARRLRS